MKRRNRVQGLPAKQYAAALLQWHGGLCLAPLQRGMDCGAGRQRSAYRPGAPGAGGWRRRVLADFRRSRWAVQLRRALQPTFVRIKGSTVIPSTFPNDAPGSTLAVLFANS